MARLRVGHLLPLNIHSLDTFSGKLSLGGKFDVGQYNLNILYIKKIYV